LKAAGFLDAMLAGGLDIPEPSDDLAPDEEPLEEADPDETDPDAIA
jgi:hypothetical protein